VASDDTHRGKSVSRVERDSIDAADDTSDTSNGRDPIGRRTDIRSVFGGVARNAKPQAMVSALIDSADGSKASGIDGQKVVVLAHHSPQPGPEFHGNDLWRWARLCARVASG